MMRTMVSDTLARLLPTAPAHKLVALLLQGAQRAENQGNAATAAAMREAARRLTNGTEPVEARALRVIEQSRAQFRPLRPARVVPGTWRDPSFAYVPAAGVVLRRWLASRDHPKV